jgi:hypothetical protein
MDQVKSNKLKPVGPTEFTYKQVTGLVVSIDTVKKTCSCDRFLDKAMCKHLVAACMILRVPLIGLTFKTSLRTVRRRLKPKADDSLQEELQAEQAVEQTTEQQVEQSEVVERLDDPMDPEPVVVALTSVAPPRRGRPPKVPKALVPDDVVIAPKQKHTSEKTRSLRPRVSK